MKLVILSMLTILISVACSIRAHNDNFISMNERDIDEISDENYEEERIYISMKDNTKICKNKCSRRPNQKVASCVIETDENGPELHACNELKNINKKREYEDENVIERFENEYENNLQDLDERSIYKAVAAFDYNVRCLSPCKKNHRNNRKPSCLVNFEGKEQNVPCIKPTHRKREYEPNEIDSSVNDYKRRFESLLESDTFERDTRQQKKGGKRKKFGKTIKDNLQCVEPCKFIKGETAQTCMAIDEDGIKKRFPCERVVRNKKPNGKREYEETDGDQLLYDDDEYYEDYYDESSDNKK